MKIENNASTAANSASASGNYTVKSGDTMWAIAQRSGVSLSALEAANPQIKNPNLIFPGQSINIPNGKSNGSLNGVSISQGANAGERPAISSMTTPSNGGIGGSAAFDDARSVLGTNISTLKYSGSLAQYLDKWPGNNVCCANFVSACLEKAGEINTSEHNDSVSGLANNLRNDPRWSATSLANAKPGDVVCFNVPGEGPMSHVEMFAGWVNGQPQFIGSNNVNPDGSQRISQGTNDYPIGAVFHFNG
jgi:spore coat assembly protein SafA